MRPDISPLKKREKTPTAPLNTAYLFARRFPTSLFGLISASFLVSLLGHAFRQQRNVFGLYSMGELLEHGRPPFLVRVYSVLLGSLSALFSVSAGLSLFFPRLKLFEAQRDSQPTICGLIYVMWSIACTLLRFIVVCRTCGCKTSTDITMAVERLREIGLLKKGQVTPPYVCLSFRILVMTMLVAQLYTLVYIWSLSHGAYASTVFIDPAFIMLAVEFTLYCTAWMQSCAWLVLLTYGPVSKASDNALDYFRTAVKEEDAHMLQRAVVYHDRCVDLIRAADRVAGAVLGVNLTVTVPLFAMLGTNLLTPGNPLCFVNDLNSAPESWAPQIGVASWCLGAVLSIVMGCTVANRANMAAHAPQKLLQRFNSQNCRLNQVVINFMTRFQSEQLGYTYFGLATVTKGSLLTVFNLMTSYLLVGVQLRQQQQQQSCGPKEDLLAYNNVSTPDIVNVTSRQDGHMQ